MELSSREGETDDAEERETLEHVLGDQKGTEQGVVGQTECGQFTQ